MRKIARLLILSSCPAAWAGLTWAGPAWTGQAGPWPAFVVAGPYGSPLAMSVPATLPLVPDLVPLLPKQRREDAGSTPPSSRVQLPSAQKSGPKKDDDDDDDDDETKIPPRPGTLPTSFVKIPSPTPYLKNHSMGPHLRPDAEFDLNERTSLGILGQMDGLRSTNLMSILNRVQPTTTTAGKTPTTPALRSRDLGFGAALEFKLGQ